ncbi:MAG TPA: hypothetical protein VKF41_08200, partial [Bryobacteraceae bacterium]|nr:hypothetical protein [Bryobacteraceae bacterium]
MKNTRRSSVWRSLAVALGDGVAFGVGVNLARSAGRPPAVDLARLSLRLERVERQIAAIEYSPPLAALPAPAAPSPFDQEVLDALLNALDAHLREQTQEVGGRLAELEARLAAGLKTLEEMDRTAVAGVESRLVELEARLATGLQALGQQDKS